MRHFKFWNTIFFALLTISPIFAKIVRTEHVAAELVSETQTIQPGQPFWVALHLKMKPDWHVYWRNAGDAGLPTAIEWDLSDGFKAGDIQWPYPIRFKLDEFVNFGYKDEAMFPVKITPPANLDKGKNVVLKARADWLVCAEICVPESAELELSLDIGERPIANDRWVKPFADVRAKLPIKNSEWKIQAAIKDAALVFQITPPRWMTEEISEIDFYPYEELTIQNSAAQKLTKTADGYQLTVPLSPDREGNPTHISGILVSDSGWRGAGSEKAMEFSTEIRQKFSGAPTTAKKEVSSLWFALLFAFAGGMILNLMPCVLPVLSLKILGFVRQAGEDRSKVFRHGLTFMAGVLASFWALAGVLLLLRAGGEQLGWGFQLQSPTFIIVLAIFMFLFGLSLFGVFEIGASLASVGQQTAAKSGHFGSFMSGVTATVVATPCTAPFMGSALGFALSQSALVNIAIFTALGLGMAAPYVLLASSPPLLKFVPKPGAWMNILKQFMGFLLMATVIWLLWVLGIQTGVNGVIVLLIALLFTGMGAWVLGYWGNLTHGKSTRLIARALAGVAIIGSIIFTVRSVDAAGATPQRSAAVEKLGDIRWQTYSPELVKNLKARGKPFFIDFTAAWCLSCQVNQKVAFGSTDVQQAFAKHSITPIIADWTSKDEVITRALAEYGRNSVPLYVLFNGKTNSAPVILPEILTPGVVLDALKNAGFN